jgi:hypothetical protein
MRLSTPKQMERLSERSRTPAFAPAVQRLQAQVSSLLEQEVQVPLRQAGYYHEYFCPEHAVQLEFDPNAPTVHRCPYDGRLFSGEPYDSARDWFVNNRLSQGALRLGLLWQLTGEQRCVDQVSEILLQYAARYATYPPAPRIHPSHPGRVTWSCLDEAVWAVALTWAFDFVRDALETTDVERVERHLLRPAADVIAQHMYRRVHNVACWNVSAIGTIGLAIGDDDLVRYAIAGEYGFERQMEKGVLDDGLWFEGSLSYHYYTLAALMSLAQAAQNSEFDLRRHPRLKPMWSAPLLYAYPDLSLPANNDCWYFITLLGECGHGIPSAAAFYEVAYGWYGDEAFAWILNQVYASAQRDSVEALLYGAQVLPTVDSPPCSSANLGPSGYAVLRSCTAHPNYLLVKYGPDGGTHGHPDKLGVSVYANGERMSPDLGTPGYGIRLNDDWYRQTLSHNTVLVDGQSQPPCQGTLRQFMAAPSDELSQVDVEATWEKGAYAGVSMRRWILWRGDYWVDLFRVHCGRSRQIDWVYHNRGTLTIAPDRRVPCAPLADGVGYGYLECPARQQIEGDLLLSWQTERSRLDLNLLQAAGAELITGLGPYNPAADQIPMVIVRHQAEEAVFAAVHCPATLEGSGGTVCWLGGSLVSDGYLHFLVSGPRGHELWEITDHTCPGSATPPPTPAPEEMAAIARVWRVRLT